MGWHAGAEPLTLHPDRCFDPEPSVRRIARELFDGTRDLPIISPHGHVPAQLFADDHPFSDPATLFVTPDHYVLRMLHSQGVRLEDLGVSRLDGGPVERDPRKVWRLFAANYHLFHGTPSGYWIDHELHEVFGVRARLNADSADRVYDLVADRLRAPEFRPRALFDRFNIEVLATTDAATDSLDHHRAIRESGWRGRVIPTFRPDGLFNVSEPAWRSQLAKLAIATGVTVTTHAEFVAALRARRLFFREHGATATDHGVESPRTTILTNDQAEAAFSSALWGDVGLQPGATQPYQSHLLTEMARLSLEDGLVMQLHPGSLRNHDATLLELFGADCGADIPLAAEFTRNLQPLLNAFGNDSRFRLILFTLDESAYSRELAPLAGYYRSVRLGAPWWFNDSMQGMRRYREQLTETAGIWNTAGFVDDTRAFCSIPARHDLSRRMDANFLAGLVARHVIGIDDARQMAQAMAYDLARDAYRLPAPLAPSPGTSK